MTGDRGNKKEAAAPREPEVVIARHDVLHLRNTRAAGDRGYSDGERSVISLAESEEAKAEITSWPGYLATPLVPLSGLATKLGVGEILFKDEGKRFGLKSFKGLGGAYAVLRILQRHLHDQHGIDGISASDFINGLAREMVTGITVAAATDGNHGLSVAWGAGMFGCRCKVYLHALVSKDREQQIANFGAEVVRVLGDYDDSVRDCARDSAANGWKLIADTDAGGGDPAVPRLVMHGYTVLVDELLRQLGPGAMTHIFVPMGVGGLAAAVVGHLWERLGPARPRFVAVEPARADCLYRSLAAGRPTVVSGDTNTFMACLAAGEVSPVAWPLLQSGVDDVLTLPDEAAVDAMYALARGVEADPPLIAGESGVAATAGLIAAMMNPTIAEALELSSESRVVVIGSEGATDRNTFVRVVGITPEQILDRGRMRLPRRAATAV